MICPTSNSGHIFAPDELGSLYRDCSCFSFIALLLPIIFLQRHCALLVQLNSKHLSTLYYKHPWLGHGNAHNVSLPRFSSGEHRAEPKDRLRDKPNQHKNPKGVNHIVTMIHAVTDHRQATMHTSKATIQTCCHNQGQIYYFILEVILSSWTLWMV